MSEYEFELEEARRTGAQVTVKWKVKHKTEEELEHEREATYTKPEDMTWMDFRDMILLEEKAMKRHVIDRLSEESEGTDISDELGDLEA